MQFNIMMGGRGKVPDCVLVFLVLSEFEPCSQSLLTCWLSRCSIVTLAYGPVAIASVIALKRLKKRANTSRPAKSLHLIVLVQFICQTLTMLFTLMICLSYWHITRFIEDFSGIAKNNRTLYIWYFSIDAVSLLAQIILMVLANSVVVWRAWVLYGLNKPVRWLLCAAWTGDVCFHIVWWGFTTHDSVNTLRNPNIPKMDDHLTMIINAVSAFATFGVNALATGLIAFRAWNYRAMLRSLSPSDKGSAPRSASYQTLLTLVEWGVLLCGVQLVAATLGAAFPKHVVGDPRYIVVGAIQTLIASLIDAHPALLALVLYQQQPVIDNSIFTSGNPKDGQEKVQRRREPRVTLTTLCFVAASTEDGPTHNGTEAETDSEKNEVLQRATI
ncbi:hypothetical protein DL96DRAFT_571928 [Flagelloscypha sp. PMI_526]|nr:hypothetical protein DL96DRAFT_571928 [Flagelloscypha sp. PMI_526]